MPRARYLLPMLRRAMLLPLALWVTACGGAAPLMHPAHALPEEQVTVGVGFSGTIPVEPTALEAANVQGRVVEEGAFAPGFAPWLGGRLGLGSDVDVGLTYTGRSARADIRKAFDLDGPDGPALSVGIGASGLLPKRREALGMRVGGFGADIPVLIGIRSDADLYAGWIGLRSGAELLKGSRELNADALDPSSPSVEDISGWHIQTGGLVGFRVGFRYLYAVIEVGAAMHWAEGTVGTQEVVIQQFNVSPAGAIVGRF